MKNKQIVTAIFCTMIASASVPSLAADDSVQPNGPSTTAQKEGGGMMSGGAMGGSMMKGSQAGGGMMDGGQMGQCMKGSGMMNHGTTSNRMLMPQLPTGNEKLQLQMQAEIMQKVGEIIGKYADKVVINKGGVQ